MRSTLPRCAAVVTVWLLTQALADARQTPGPVIHRATLQTETGVLTIAGVRLGANLQVMVDGQPVTVLPGATDTVVEVQAPASLLTVPGSYRLTVVDPVRRAWDGFVVSSPGAATTVAWADTSRGAAGAGGAAPVATSGASFDGDTAVATRNPGTIRPLAIIEDTGSPWSTAIGHHALDSNVDGIANTAAGFNTLTSLTAGSFNTGVGYAALQAANGDDNTGLGAFALGVASTGDQNTAVGYSSLQFNSTGSDNTAVGRLALGSANANSNTAIGIRAGSVASLGDSNIFVGAHVTGVTGDANTIRIGTPVSGSVGQDRAFIAGIVGVNVNSTQAVYINASGQLGSGAVVPGANTVDSSKVVADTLTAADLATNAVGTAELADNAVTSAKVGFNYAGSASEGGAASDLTCTACVAATEVGFAFAGLGANTFGGTQQIGTGNLDLAPSTAANGNVTKSGVRFLHNPGFRNTFLGETAGTTSVTGGTNTGVGADALRSIAGGDANTGSGYGALFLNSSGTGNTASGFQSLFQATGSYNTAIGFNAGVTLTTGSHNIYLGSEVIGTGADANTMRLGLPFNPTSGAGQNKTFIAGIAGTVLTTPAVQVFVDANGQLGTLTPPPIMGTVNDGVTPGATPRVDALQRQLDEQRRLNAALHARLEKLEAEVAALVRRR